jgi:glucose-1-phosphate adenylyltransferase
VDDASRVTGFAEKPAAPTPLPERPETALASMGIYLFNAHFLYEQLIRDAADSESGHDFGKDIIPHLVHDGGRIYAHNFARSCINMNGEGPYWRDVGTIEAFWEATMELTTKVGRSGPIRNSCRPRSSSSTTIGGAAARSIRWFPAAAS